MEEKENGK